MSVASSSVFFMADDNGLRKIIDQIIRENRKLTDDLRDEKNRMLAEMSSALNSIILASRETSQHLAELDEKLHDFKDVLDGLHLRAAKMEAELAQRWRVVELRYQNDEQVRRILIHLISDIYEKLFKEKPALDLDDI